MISSLPVNRDDQCARVRFPYRAYFMKHETTPHLPEQNWFDRSYKGLVLFSVLLILACVVYQYQFYQEHGDIARKDVSLTGGTTVTVFDGSLDLVQIKTVLARSLPDAHVRPLSDVRTGAQHGFSVESQATAEKVKEAVEQALTYPLTSENSSIAFSGATLSKQFYQQLLRAMGVAFLLMALVVFLIFGEQKYVKLSTSSMTLAGTVLLLPGISFVSSVVWMGLVSILLYGSFACSGRERQYVWGSSLLSILSITLASSLLVVLGLSLILTVLYVRYSIPSAAVVLAAVADILMTLVTVNLLGIPLSAAGIIAFLMLIGYSVDTDILLTTRVLREHTGTINARIWGAFKTGITMTLTALAAVGVSLYVTAGYSETLSQIFTIMLIGLGFDIFNTWVTNASLLKWYMERKR